MQCLTNSSELEQSLESLDLSQLAFVPTMGALHEGHLSLIRRAKQDYDKVIVSVFVNPTQFAAGEDLDKYPRSLELDQQKSQEAGADFFWTPLSSEIYPELKENPDLSSINLIKANPDFASGLCGDTRPGHFDGVSTVVYRLLKLVKASALYLGEKDYQQYMVLSDMVVEKDLDVQVYACPIVREKNGLAMSSRNQYLTGSEREQAAEIYKTLIKIRSFVLENSMADIDVFLANEKELLNQKGFDTDYIEIFWGRIFIAAKLGSTRLIDNLALE